MRPEILGIMLPIIAVVLGIGVAMLSIYLDYRKRREMFALYHQERMAALEKGIDLPPLPEGFFPDEARRRSPHRQLLKGLILLFLGLGLLVALFFNKPSASLWALLPVGVGLAHLVYYFTVGRKEADALLAAQAAKEAQQKASA
jgi:uncharacterized protein YacL